MYAEVFTCSICKLKFYANNNLDNLKNNRNSLKIQLFLSSLGIIKSESESLYIVLQLNQMYNRYVIFLESIAYT